MYTKNMKVEIKDILRNLKDVSFMQPIYEAVSNAVESGSTVITISLAADRNTLFDETDSNDAQPFIERVTIKDNGAGFNDKNIESFCKYYSDLKAEIGCKGVGRFTWLKIFRDVHISSKMITEKGFDLLSFKFDATFDEYNSQKLFDQITHHSEKIQENETIITFDHVLNDNKKIPLDIELIKEDISSNIFPALMIKKDNKDPLIIYIEDEMSGNKTTIDPAQLPNLYTEKFSIAENVTPNKQKISFELKYNFLKDGKKKRQNFYCANNRAVLPFSKIKEDTVAFNLPGTDSSIMFLCSEYFDKLVGDSRNMFECISNEADVYAPLSWKDINNALKTKVTRVIEKSYPEIKQSNEDKIEKLKDDNPHLAEYIERNRSGIGATSVSEIINKSKKQFEYDKEESVKQLCTALRKAKLKKPQIDDFKKAASRIEYMAALDLAQYIKFRQQIIEALKQLNEDKATQEELFHDLFVKKKFSSFKRSVLDTNLWLLDDKFMTYSYVASDTEYSRIADKIWGQQVDPIDDSKRPDLFIAFSDQETAKYRDCVIVEFKASGASTAEKRKAIAEIWDNMGAVKDNFPNIQHIYGYIVMDFNEVLDKTFERSGQFRPVFSRGNDKLYFGFNPGLNMACFLISTSNLANDADARNRSFLDIIRGKNQ
mgnify:FL=1